MTFISTDRSDSSLLLCGLFYEAICFMSYLVLFCSHVFQSFSLWGANLSSFRAFVRFVLVWFCWLPLPLGVCEGLRFVIVALLGLFSYLLLILSCKSNDIQKLLICVKIAKTF